MCLKWTNGSNECSKSATDKMYIQCKVKAPYILLVQNVIKIIENTVQLLIFILKINRRSEKNPRRCISIKWLSFILQSCLVSYYNVTWKKILAGKKKVHSLHWQLVLENTGNDVVWIIPMCFIYNVRFDVFLKRLSHLPFFFVKDTERCPDNRKKSYRRVVLCSHLTSLGCWRIPRPSSSGPSNWDLKQKAEMATADRWPSQDGPLLSSQVLSLPRALITTNELAFTVNKPATSEMLGRQSACIWLLSGRGKWRHFTGKVVRHNTCMCSLVCETVT